MKSQVTGGPVDLFSLAVTMMQGAFAGYFIGANIAVSVPEELRRLEAQGTLSDPSKYIGELGISQMQLLPEDIRGGGGHAPLPHSRVF